MANRPRKDLQFEKGYGQNYAQLRQKRYNGKKDYSVRELAEEIKISYSVIGKIENEIVKPTVEQVYIYKNFFGVSLDYLTGTFAKNLSLEVRKYFFDEMSRYTNLSIPSLEALHNMKDSDALYTIKAMIENADRLFKK